jgi:hypothetical protein
MTTWQATLRGGLMYPLSQSEAALINAVVTV